VQEFVYFFLCACDGTHFRLKGILLRTKSELNFAFGVTREDTFFQVTTVSGHKVVVDTPTNDFF
jgi:hypothetical protein